MGEFDPAPFQTFADQHMLPLRWARSYSRISEGAAMALLGGQTR